MTEKIIVRQNKSFEVGFWAVDPNQPDSDDYQPVQGLHEVTPYGMMLVSLATCTAQVVLSYAQHHGVNLDEVEFRLQYERFYQEDCENCENINQYGEKIHKAITFLGDLTEVEKMKLFRIAHQCPIEKIFKQGIEINSELRTQTTKP
jgi:putative redox protein